MIIPVCFWFCLCMLAIGVFPPREVAVGVILYPGKKEMIRRSVHYLIYTLAKYLLMQLIIIPGMEHLNGRSIHCLLKVRAPACILNWYWQQLRKRVWCDGSRRISEVTLNQLCLGLCSRAPPMGGYDISHTSPLRKTTPRWCFLACC